ncbi:MAG: GT4 family glycosyltransferase PelF [Candidatus Omnitrophica bacterium]|nr:GT4 family glycosyltransferase PelF [Candidatus Omnitrophota bacterium]
MNDVCLILEGTYPYVAGGVSSWVNTLIKRMKDISFSILYVGPQYSLRKKMNYVIPNNVLDFREIYLFDYQLDLTKKRTSKKNIAVLEEFLISIRRKDTKVFAELASKIRSGELNFYDIVVSYDSWKILEKIYTQEGPDQSFIDYFWTWRFVYLPFFSILTADIPPARTYHSVSTGYAGVLGALAKIKTNRPFILTEHGIYTRERKIDISQSDWIYADDLGESKLTEREDFFKDWWIRLFTYFSKLAYDQADEITTIFEGNRHSEIAEGADPAKIRVIPNGVDFESLNSLERKTDLKIKRIGFMGRVVSIKDVKTFITACSIVHKQLKDIEVYIMGPTDEDEEYFADCKMLVETQKMENIIKFTGKVNIKEYYPKLDIVVLTSVSEGQPLVILEAFSCGIPCVATDVGACSELIHGSTPDDKLLGSAGIITHVADPEETANAILKILKNPDLSARMGDVAIKRIKAYYLIDKLIAEYKKLYNHSIENIRW